MTSPGACCAIMQAITAWRSCSCGRSRKSSLPLACSCSQSRVASLIGCSMQPGRKSCGSVAREIVALVNDLRQSLACAQESLLDSGKVIVVIVQDEERRTRDLAAEIA